MKYSDSTTQSSSKAASTEITRIRRQLSCLSSKPSGLKNANVQSGILRFKVATRWPQHLRRSSGYDTLVAIRQRLFNGAFEAAVSNSGLAWRELRFTRPHSHN